MPKHVLITGGTGLIGSRLTDLLVKKGYDVAHLSRSKTGYERIKTYKWEISKNVMEPEALEKAEYVIHLAGANLSGQRWTESYKETILKSRTESSYLLFQKLQLIGHKIKAFIAASGISYYGADSGPQLVHEDYASGDGFLAYVTREWEKTVQKINKLDMRVVILRTGVVLSTRGGALEKLSIPVKLGLGAPLGSGKQYMSWIHLDDLCNMYIKAMEDSKLQGVYNAVAPQPVTNDTFTRTAAKVLGKPYFLPRVPSFAIKLAVGEMGSVVLGGNNVSSEKVESAGFKFQYEQLEPALRDLLKR
ncbi:MAG: TIGR01777 family oxidoreductase [Candidatus Cyclobacteriaceae bacterium M3_2C_046]